MESQIRVLADYAFMLRDYDLALQNYRLLSSDYKTDKAWKRYAGVQVSDVSYEYLCCKFFILIFVTSLRYFWVLAKYCLNFLASLI